jgi:NMD protein affecting ribosome stability and mRNA decay
MPKAAGALVCSDCGLVQHGGKWFRGAPPLAKLRSGRCPACRRIREGYPAGTIRMHPAFLEHREEILRLVRNVERAERVEHPLERLMEVKETGGKLVVTTTGIHLARQIAHRIARRFHRKARLRYADQEDLVHVDWD